MPLSGPPSRCHAPSCLLWSNQPVLRKKKNERRSCSTIAGGDPLGTRRTFRQLQQQTASRALPGDQAPRGHTTETVWSFRCTAGWWRHVSRASTPVSMKWGVRGFFFLHLWCFPFTHEATWGFLCSWTSSSIREVCFYWGILVAACGG